MDVEYIPVIFKDGSMYVPMEVLVGIQAGLVDLVEDACDKGQLNDREAEVFLVPVNVYQEFIDEIIGAHILELHEVVVPDDLSELEE
jgi:hypothetical protein